MAVLAVIGIIYGALVAIVQSDLKKLVAYSSVSHLGFIVLGIFALTSQGLQGGVIQMINHGLTTGALFLLVGMIYERRHTKMIADFGGLARVMPIFAGVFLFMAFASIGLPGLNGFVGEFLILIGSYATLPVYAIVAAIGVILAAIYLLWAYERVFTGEVSNPDNEALTDLSWRETLIFVPLVALIIVLGVYPKDRPRRHRAFDRSSARQDRGDDGLRDSPAREIRGYRLGRARVMSASYLSIGPEILLILGAVVVLMVDVFADPRPRIHVWIVSGTYLAVAVAIVAQWHRVSTDGPSQSWGGTMILHHPSVAPAGDSAGGGGVGHSDGVAR